MKYLKKTRNRKTPRQFLKRNLYTKKNKRTIKKRKTIKKRRKVKKGGWGGNGNNRLKKNLIGGGWGMESVNN